MPSFLSDDSSPVFANSDLLDLALHDPGSNHHLALAGKARPDGGALSHAPSGPIHETDDTFDESSATSTHDSDLSDATPMAANGNSNGNGTRPTSMSSLTNGKGWVARGADDTRADSPRTDSRTGHLPATDIQTDALPANGGDVPAHALLQNGSSFSLPDRSASRQSLADADRVPTKRSSDSYTNYPPSTQSAAPRPPKKSTDSSIFAVPASSSHPELRRSTSQAPSLTPAAAAADVAARRLSPHRLSSPPIYQSSTSASNASISGHLQPPPPGPALRQRHTLEVPKLAPGRLSRDGQEFAQATGRFSPTAVAAGARRASLNLARRNTRSMQSDFPRDEIVPDEDAVRWAEAYRQKRASKRKRKEEEDDDRVLVGTKVDETHANWVTAYNMLTGIRVAVSRTNAKLDRELTDADFDAKQKSTFDIAGNELVPSAKYDFKFKDYAPWVFRRLRTLFRLDPADYLISLTGKYILSELGSPGKSGSFFYFSRDYKYIIKTIHHGEHKFLRKVLKEYYRHVTDNPNTLLSQFYGLHRVKMPYGKKIHFVVMNNLFPPHRDIHTTFDIKGSTVGRNYVEDDLAENPRATLKDLNWLRRKQHLELGVEKKRRFLEQLQRDVALLKRLGIMDYSLLIGIHDMSRGNEENLRDKTLRVFNPGGEKVSEDEPPPSVLMRTPSKMENARKARELRQMIRHERPVPMGQALDRMPDELGEGHSRPGFVFNQDDGGFRATHEDNTPADEIYYLGVIDCLTHYGMIKKIEHFWKGLSNDRAQISAQPPEQYGDRFYNFIAGTTLSPEEARREAQRRDREAQAQAENTYARSPRRRSGHTIPPMPSHQPPALPGSATEEMATREARRADQDAAVERQVPERTLKTSPAAAEARESLQHEPILPIVEEAGEQGRVDGDVRPRTPSKDKPLPPARAPPPTPPKTTTIRKPDSSDSGFAGSSNGNGNGAAGGGFETGRESLNKSLPPLPNKEGTEDSGVRMVA